MSPEKSDSLRRALGAAAIALMVLLAIGRSAWGTRLDSFTIDEPWHLVAGATYDRLDDFRLNPEQPPLVKVWAGAWMGRDFRLPTLPVLHEKGDEREFVENTMYRDNDALRAQARARAALWTLNGLLLVGIGLLLWRAFGLAWALASLAFIALEPSIGAHLPVVMMDLPLALTLTLAALAAGLWLATWRWRWAIAFGVGIGLALGAKHSALAGLLGLAGFSALCVLWPLRDGPGRWRRLGHMALAWGLGWALLWAQYGFHFHASPDGRDPFNMPMDQKVAGLQVPMLRTALQDLDTTHLLPRSYLWGLADTVRAGVEGRGQSEFFLWGHDFQGSPPWFTWPSVVASKLPLPLLALGLLGALALWRAPLPRSARACLLALLAMSAAHLLALAGSQGAYAGIRHALPLVMVIAIVGGAVLARGFGRDNRLGGAALAACLLLTAAMTLREPRLWEYHNEIAGGSANAWRQFGNEGLDLGQRAHEVRAFYDSTMARTGEPVYYDYALIRAQSHRAGIPLLRRVESIEDENVEGRYSGWFVVAVDLHQPWPTRDWDPRLFFRGLHRVTRMGYVEVWHGEQRLPRARAGSMASRLMDYLYQKGGHDWVLVEKRASEVVKVAPFHLGAAIELGNARLRLGDAAGARTAYMGPLDLKDSPADPLTRAAVLAQVAKIDAGVPPKTITPLRNPWME